MSNKKCIIRGCTKLCKSGVLTCSRCISPNPAYAVQFYGSLWRGPRDYKLPCHTIKSNFPWTTCGTPAQAAVDCATLEKHMIETTERVEYLHTHWFWAAHALTDKMHYTTGAYVHELTPAHLETLRLKRDLRFQAWDVSPSNMRRCIKDCVVNCTCHPWYGIVLTESGTKIDTNASPYPSTPYTSCVDCYHLACRNARSQGGHVWSQHLEYGIPLEISTCKACVDKPQRRRVWRTLDGYHLC